MAIIKHIAMKSGNYTGAIHYLLFQHDEFTQEEIVDDYGVPVLREEYYFDGINCEPYAFDYECADLNRRFHKNCNRDEIKQHHYIISFDPKDVTECGLTGEKVQALGMEYAKKNFPGHQMIVCTHTDGHNKSGNIHVHIVMNSLRKEDVDRKAFMEREIDSKAGYKHHVTPKLLAHLKGSLMSLCKREQLHQVDLLRRPKKRITEREYYANRRAKEKGKKPGKTPFESQKDFLRKAIEECASESKNENDFRKGLKEKYDITLTVSRGRYGYIHPERNKPIRGRMLGTDYEEKHLLEVFARNAKNEIHRLGENKDRNHIKVPEKTSEDNLGLQPTRIPNDYPYQQSKIAVENTHNQSLVQQAINHQQRKATENKDKPTATSTKNYSQDGSTTITTKYVQPLPSAITTESKLKLVTDLQSCVKAKANYYYARKVRISNLQKMAETVAYAQEHNFDSYDEVENMHDKALLELRKSRRELDGAKEELRDINEQVHFTGQYLSTKKAYAGYKKAKDKEKYRSEHQADLVKYEASRDYLRKRADGKKQLPTLAELKEQKMALVKQRESLYAALEDKRASFKEIDTMLKNMDAILAIPDELRQPVHDRSRSAPARPSR